MAAPRPNFLDLRSQSQTSVTRPLKSPRLHVAGDVPPELSPLDAFALQSRLLAKQLEDSAKSDKRMSRLPPLTTESPLVQQGRSDYFRSMTQDSYSDNENGLASPPLSGQPQSHSQPMTPTGLSTRTPEVEEPLVRPQSMHPRMSRMPPVNAADDDGVPAPPPVPAYSRERQRLLQQQQPPVPECDTEEPSFFGARRERSPSPIADDWSETELQRDATVLALESGSGAAEDASSKEVFSFTEPDPPQAAPVLAQPRQIPAATPRQMQSQNPSHDQNPPTLASPANLHPLAQSPEKSPIKKNSFDSTTGGLAPPRQLFPKRSSSILSSPLDGADTDSNSAMGASYHSLGAPRKLSNSSSMVSPGLGSFHRTPSFGSDLSAQLPRPSFNFSRPLSRVSTPGLESPARQASSDSHTSYSQSSFVFADDTAHTPVSLHSHSDGFPELATTQPDDNSTAAAPSYVYSKYSLPRGKMLQRSGPPPPDNQMPAASYQWEQPMVLPSNVQTFPLGGGQAPPSPPTRPSSSAGLAPRASLERTKLSTELSREPSAASCGPISSPSHQPSPDANNPPDEECRGRSGAASAHDAAARARTPASVATANTSTTSDSANTIKPRSTQTLASAVDIPADEHVELAINLHEQGQLNESTYHLRHAARKGHPTGMLLYALACRHGWGMRANPREGAMWLRKAADCVGLEIADDEAQIKDGKRVDAVDLKTRKAQFALSIYELGVSYMNGWGIDQDRALGLRCFEIAGSWGDVDALAEAGFCYAQGLGCKKNLKRSAHFYRQAEAKGMSMVGNSWIHKGKYNDDKNSAKPVKEQKMRSKSRSRNIFGLKHSS